MIERFCEKCGTRLSKNCKGNFCNHCRDRSGKNNPFYGKRHSADTITKIKEKTRENSKELWGKEEYREKVIRGVSKPRSEEGKKNISRAVKKWYEENPVEIEKRRKRMMLSWENGEIIPNEHSVNRSKSELEFFQMLSEEWAGFLNKDTIHIGKHWFLPDALVDFYKVVVEFYGDFWHANPKMYFADEIVRDNITAKEIWEKDKNRICELIGGGYDVVVVWESDFKEDRERTVFNTACLIEELCNT